MKIVITGGRGFIGLKLASALLARGTIADRDGEQQRITRIVLADQAFPDLPKDARLESLAGDISDAAFAARAVQFLLADAPYITGQIIAVDGGRSVSL